MDPLNAAKNLKDSLGTEPIPSAPSGIVMPSTPSELAILASGGKLKMTPLWAMFDRIFEALMRGELGDTLILTLPPQHSKSMFWSFAMPALYLARRPEHRIVLGSYSFSYAAKLGRRVRDLVERHSKLLGLRVRGDVSGAAEWELEAGGGMLSSGLGGGIAGRSAELCLCDDLVPDAVAASSFAEKEKSWQWWIEDFSTRVQAGGIKVLVQTRRATDDIVGRIIEQSKDSAERVTLINLPAIAEQDEDIPEFGWGRKTGEPLNPLLHSLERLRYYEKSKGVYTWATQYQGRPYPRGGGSFKSEWITVAATPPASSRVRSWDLAISEKKSACRTAGALMSRRFDQNTARFHIEHLIYGRWGPGERDAHIIATAKQDGPGVPILIEKEGGSGGTAQIHHLRQQLPGWAILEAAPRGSKEVRADALASAAQGGLVTMTAAAWNRDLADELDAFPNGPTCDLVDAASHGFNHLAAHATPTRVPKNYTGQAYPSRRLFGAGTFGAFEAREDVAL